MATMNPFDLLGDDDAEDPSQLIAAQQQKVAAASAAAPKKAQAQPQPKQVSQPQAKLPSKPLPPAQAVREATNEYGRGGGRGGGRGYGRGRGGYSRDSSNENSFSNVRIPAGQSATEDGDNGRPSERREYSGPRGGYRGGHYGGFTNGEVGDEERPRRIFERRSGAGRGNEIKREGSGPGNWGTQTGEIAQVTEETVSEVEKILGDEKPMWEEETDGNKENSANEPEEKEKEKEKEKEQEDKEMTLDEYEKVLGEKRKGLQTLKAEERKVDAKDFESMQQLSNKKGSDDVFIKLGSDKDKRKEAFEKDEKAKKSVSINEFLKPAEGERYYSPGGRGRGRGRGPRGFSNRDALSNVVAPSIEDRWQFPALGGK